VSDRLVEPVASAFVRALPRIITLVPYGSVVTGDFIEGFSDLDLVAVLPEPLTIEDAIALQREMPEPDGVAYVQPTFHVQDRPEPHLVPGAFRVEIGELPDGFVATEETLIRSGADVLRELPSLVADDARAWTGAIGEKRPRHVRLMVTRLKPAVRATLVTLGEPVLEVWRAPWDDLVDRWRQHDDARSTELGDVLGLLRNSERDDRACGEAVLRLISWLARSNASDASSDRFG
jgi:Nucleotidyltransferase domain